MRPCEEYDIPFTVYHPDGSKTTIKIPVFKDEHGDEILTIYAAYMIDRCKAQKEIEILKRTNQPVCCLLLLLGSLIAGILLVLAKDI